MPGVSTLNRMCHHWAILIEKVASVGFAVCFEKDNGESHTIKKGVGSNKWHDDRLPIISYKMFILLPVFTWCFVP